MLRHFRDPVYIHRPGQILRRLWYGIRPPDSPETTTLPWGGALTVLGDDRGGRTILRRGVAEFAVAEACFRLSTPGTISVDAGANVGQMTSALAYALGSAGSVYAFEPHPIVFGYLQQNVTRLRSEVPEVTCQVFNEALGQKTGEATLYVPERWSENTGVASLRQESNAEEIQVPVQRLDDRVPEPIQVLKLDVQGLETEVLRGAERHLEEETIRHVLFEAHDIQESAAADLLRSYGYTIFAIEKTVMGPRLHRTLPDNEHNFIASLDAAECRARFSSSGWRCLHTA